MVAAWEIPPKVQVGILHTDYTTIAWALGLRNLQIPGGLPILPVAGMPYDMARNFCVQEGLRRGADALFFLDSDVIPPNDAILRLLATKEQVVSGLYCRRSPPWSVPVAQKNGSWLTKFKPREKVEVDLVGAGCLLLRREFLIDMAQRFPLDPENGKIWFHWRSDKPNLPPGMATSEDFSTCIAARQNGYKVILDTSITCRHQGLADSEFMSFKPAEVLPIT